MLANRNSPPFVADVLADLASRGRRRVLAVATAAYSGYSSCRQYREDVGLALAGADLDLEVRKLPPFYDLPGFAGDHLGAAAGRAARRTRPCRRVHPAGVHHPFRAVERCQGRRP